MALLPEQVIGGGPSLAPEYGKLAAPQASHSVYAGWRAKSESCLAPNRFDQYRTACHPKRASMNKPAIRIASCIFPRTSPS